MTKKNKRKYAKAPNGPRKLLLKLTEEDGQRLDALVSRWSFLSHTGLATQAMRIGLEMIEADPSVMLKSAEEIAKAAKVHV
jgi:hypothetical protein